MLDKLKGMTWREKLEHIWEYYKLPIIGTILGLLFIFSMLNQLVFNPPPKSYAQLAAYSTYVDSEAVGVLCRQMNDVLVPDPERETIYNSVFVVNETNNEMAMANTQKLVAMVAAKELDIFIIDKEALATFAYQGFFMPLTDALGAEAVSALGDKVLTATERRDTDPDDPPTDAILNDPARQTPYAISLEGNKRLAAAGVNTQGQVICIAGNTQHLDNAKAILAYILDGTAPDKP